MSPIPRWPHGYRDIVQGYGDPYVFLDDHAAWEAQILAAFELPFALHYCGAPVRRLRAHHLVGPDLVAVFVDIQAEGLEAEVREFNGVYAFRQKRTNPHEFSVHTFGAAIDLNASRNPLGGQSTQHPGLIEIFKAHGWTWGGDFSGTRDPMHWQAAGGY